MHKNRARRKKEVGTAEAILKPCHVVMENLDLKLSTSSTSHLLSDLSHTVVEMLNESCFVQETNFCSNTVKLNKSDVNLKKPRVRTFDIQSNRSKNKQVPLDSFHSFSNKRSQSSASDTDVDNTYSIKKKKQRKFNKYDKYGNSETRFGKNSTMKKINNKRIGKGLIDKNSKYLSSEEICSPERGYRLNHSNISASNEYFAEDSRYVPQNIDLKECSVVITKTDLSRISGMKDAVTLKSSIKQTDINVGKRNCKRSSCSSVNSSNSVLAVSDSFRSSDNKSANHQSSHTFAMQTLINDTNTEDSGNLKRRYSVDSSSSTEIGSEMNRTNYSHIDEDIYSKGTTLKLDNFETKFRELDAESNISTSSLAELRRSCNVDNFSDTDIDEKTEKEVNYPLTYFAHKFKHDISGSGSESDVIDNSEKKKRNVSEVPLSVYNSDAKCEMREDPLHSDTFLNDCDQRKRGSKKKSLDFETASNYSDHITKAGGRKHSDSETSSDVHALNYSGSLSAIASNYSYTIPYGHRTLRKKCSHSEASLNCVDSGNDSNCTDYKFRSKGSSKMKSSKSKTASNCSNLTLNAKRSRRKHSDSETSLNYSDYNSKNKKHLKKKPKIGSNYSDLALKAKRNTRKHSDSETSLNYSDYNSEYKKRLKKKPKTGSNYSDLALKAKRNRRKLSDSETDSNYSDSVYAKKSSRASLKYSDSKYKKKSRKKLSSLNYSISIPHANRRLRRKRLDSETSLNSDSNIASGYCNSTAKCKVNRRKKPLHSEISNYSNSIYKYERNEKKKTLEYKTASDYSERNVQQKLLDSETSSNCSDSISKRKRIGRHKVLDSGISSNCYDSTSKLKIRSKSLDSENSLNLSAMQISPHLSDCETDSNSSVSTVLVPDKVKSTDKNLFVYDHSRSNKGRRKCAEKLNNLNKTDNRKNAQKLVIDDFCDHEDKAVLFAKHHIEEKVNKNAFSECSKACNVLLTRLNLNCNNHFESSKMTNDEEYDQDKIDIGKKNNVEMAGRDTSAVSINSSTVQDATINDPNLKDSFESNLKTTETRKIHRKHTRFMSDNANSPDIVGDNLKSHVANEKWQNFSKVPAEYNKNNVVSFLESSYIQSENDKNGEKGLKSDHFNYVFKSVTGKNYVIDIFDGEGIEKLYVTVVLKSDSNSKETIKRSSDINKLEENCEFGCKKYKYNCIHMNKSSKIITDSSSPKKNSKKFSKNTDLLKDEGGKCKSVFHDTNSPKKNSKNTDLQKSDSGRCESISEPSSSPKKQPAGDDHSKVFNSLSDKYTNIDNLMHYSSHKQNITSVISDKSCQKSTNTLKQKPTNQTAYKRTNTKSVGRSSDSCIQCFTEFSSLRESYNHTCSGKQKRGYLCMYCEKIFPSCKSIQTHERIHKNDKA